MAPNPEASQDAATSVLEVEGTPSGRFDAVPATLRPALEARGFDTLTDVQRAVLAAGVAGRDLQISSRTGSGKTVALGFVLAPPLEAEPAGTGPEALIIVPTRELAKQVSEELGWLLAGVGARVAAVTGGTPLHRERRLLAARPRVLVGTPGRLLDHLRSGALALEGVRALVLDEADQMLDMGFREELEAILEATPATRSTHMVSATFPDGIQALAARYQRDPLAIEGTPPGDAHEHIAHEGYLVHGHDRYAALVNLLLQAGEERTLVFVERRADAVEVAERLEADGFAAMPLSGELAQSQRERTLAAFRAGRVRVLVATDVAARGLDVPDVGTVIHTAPPIDAEVYIHRSGRTGRAGKQGRSVLLAPPSRLHRVNALLGRAGVELRWLPAPCADEVRAQVGARARAELAADLDRLLCAEAGAEHLRHAEELLEGREAAPLVAALLSRLSPTGGIEPRELERPELPDTQRSPKRPRSQPERPSGGKWPAGKRPDGRRPDARRPDASRPEARRPDARRAGGVRFDRSGGRGGVRFFMNFGLNQGASPGRVVAAVCRRGQVTGADIGAIAIHPNASTFDVKVEVAERFERLAGRPDARDPRTRIRRDQGPKARPFAGAGSREA